MAIQVSEGKYKVYHIPGQKVGCTTDIQKRVTEQQGFKPGEYDIVLETTDIDHVSRLEIELQKKIQAISATKIREKMNEI